ncbi:MAG: fhlA 2, partial [Myxococcales bacterium]|nr:fhlA 2 [Myxococcales bacterium]
MSGRIAGFSAACDSAWTEGDVELLEVVARGVAHAVERCRVDEALRASEARFRAMCTEAEAARADVAAILCRISGLEALPELGGAPPAAVFSLPTPPSMLDGSPANEARVPFVRPPGFIDELERAHVARTLAETSWVIEGEHGAARRLGLHPNTLRS